MLPAGVVVGMRPPASQQQPKNVQGNTMGRVVVGGPHMVGTRPQSPAVSKQFTLKRNYNCIL